MARALTKGPAVSVRFPIAVYERLVAMATREGIGPRDLIVRLVAEGVMPSRLADAPEILDVIDRMQATTVVRSVVPQARRQVVAVEGAEATITGCEHPRPTKLPVGIWRCECGAVRGLDKVWR